MTDTAVDLSPHLARKEDGGKFLRKPSTFRNWITPDGRPGPTGEGGFSAEAGRYHLYVALPCPWCTRVLVALLFKKLTRHISVSIARPVMTDGGISFGEFPGSTPDPVMGAEYLHQLYGLADPNYNGRATVPVLWDKQRETIVNNESVDIMHMLDTAFAGQIDNTVTLYPAARAQDIDAIGQRLYDGLNNGVYRAGFATEQDAYEGAVQEVFETLDHFEAHLSGRTFLVGEELTEADIRLFATLVRFDTVYHSLFKCNIRRLADYPNLSAHLDRMLQFPECAASINMQHVKRAYFSLPWLNPTGIYPAGPQLAWMDALEWRDDTFANRL